MAGEVMNTNRWIAWLLLLLPLSAPAQIYNMFSPGGDLAGAGSTWNNQVIANGAITLSKFQNINASSILCNNGGAPAAPLMCTVAQVKTLLAYTLASSDFANQGTTTTVLHGNAAGNPSFGQVNLATDVTGSLPASAVTPPGSTTQVIYNNAGALGADAGLVWNSATQFLSIGTSTNISAGLTLSPLSGGGPVGIINVPSSASVVPVIKVQGGTYTGVTAGFYGGDVQIFTASAPTGVGAESAPITIQAGNGSSGTGGGDINMVSGNGDGNPIGGGIINMQAGSATGVNGPGGLFILNAGNAFGTGTGGVFQMKAGNGGAGAGTGGAVSITSGSPGSGGVPGAINITAAAGIGAASNGGNITMTTGGAPIGQNANGGILALKIGVGRGTGVSGQLQFLSNATLEAFFDGSNRNIVSTVAANAVGDTNGFFYLPRVAGVPTGVPANLTGNYANATPLRYDSADDRLYAYNSGWKIVGNNLLSPLISGHLFFGGSAPAVSACGTGPAIDGNATDNSGTVTVGTIAAASCTVTFATAYSTWNHCRVTSQSTIASFAYSYTLSVLTVTGTSLVGDKFDYQCDGS